MSNGKPSGFCIACGGSDYVKLDKSNIFRRGHCLSTAETTSERGAKTRIFRQTLSGVNEWQSCLLKPLKQRRAVMARESA